MDFSRGISPSIPSKICPGISLGIPQGTPGIHPGSPTEIAPRTSPKITPKILLCDFPSEILARIRLGFFWIPAELPLVVP